MAGIPDKGLRNYSELRDWLRSLPVEQASPFARAGDIRIIFTEVWSFA